MQFSTWLSERLTVVDIALADSRTFQKPLSKSASQDSTCNTTSTAQSTSSSKRRRKTPSQYVDAGTHHQNQRDNSEENEDVEAAGCVIAKQISEGALRIREEHLLPWQDDLESIKPRNPRFNQQDMQLACSPEDEITSDQLDWDCERYSKMAIYRARISEMIRCLLERTRPANHKRSRDQAEREERRKGSNNRRGDRSIADIVVVLTNASYPRFGVRAYNLCALLAGKYLKLDLRGCTDTNQHRHFP